MRSVLKRSLAVVLIVSAAVAFAAMLASATPAGAEEVSPTDGPWVSSVVGTKNPGNPSELEILVTFTKPVDPSTILAGETVQVTTTGNVLVPIASVESPEPTTLDIRIEGAGTYESLTVHLAGDASQSAAVIADLNGTPLGANSSHPQGRNYTSEVAPKVTSVVVPAPGTYDLGASLHFDVWMSEPTFVDTTGGTPSLPILLENGHTVYASYLEGSGTEVLTFRYTVAEGDTGEASLGPELQLDGGTLSDGAGFAAVPTIHNAVTSGIVLDGIAPTKEVAEPTPTAPTPNVAASTATTSVAAAPSLLSTPAKITPPASCASRRTAVIHLLAPRGVRLRRAALSIDGRRVASLGRGKSAVPVSFLGWPASTVTLTIRATTISGVHLISVRRYHLCSDTPLRSADEVALRHVGPERELTKK